MSPPQLKHAAMSMVDIIMSRVKKRAARDQAQGLTPRESIAAITEEMLSETGRNKMPDGHKVTYEDLLTIMLMDYYSELLEQGVPSKFSDFLCAPLFDKLKKVVTETHFYQLDGSVKAG